MLASDGLRGAQLTILGLNFNDVPARLVTSTRPRHTLYDAASGWAVLAQRVDTRASAGKPGRPLRCTAPAHLLPNVTGAISLQELIDKVVKPRHGFWPHRNPAAFGVEDTEGVAPADAESTV